MHHHEDSHRLRRRPGVLAVMAGIVLLAACGGGTSAGASAGPSAPGGSSTAASTSSADPGGSSQAGGSAQSQQLAFAQCMRTHGVPDFPDSGAPAQPSQGSDLDPSNPADQAARQACRSLQPSVRQDQAQSTRSLAESLKFSQCMRQHGITNYPDPGPNSGPEGGSGINLRGVDMNSPQFQAAKQACRQYQVPGSKDQP